jgi:Domain of Unknown Function (DUF928)
MLSKKILINLSTATFCLIGFSLFNKAWASLGGFRSADVNQAKNIEQRRTLGSGTRSQCQVAFQPNTLTLLVPDQNVVHKAASSQPSFYVQTKTGSKTPLNFTIVDPEVSEPIAESLITVSEPGIKKIELPNRIQLEQKKVYLWYIGVPCSNNSEYHEILTSSVEFVPASTMVLNKLQSSTKTSKIARIYAENGYWYDALDVSFKDRSSSGSASLYFQQLLSDVGLTF